MNQDCRIVSYPSDKNGCGFYRSLVPLNYFTGKLEWDASFQYQFIFDLNLVLRTTHWLRFQRQCTENQYTCIREYKKFIDQNKAQTRLMYELDDLVHGIEPHNVLAYQFYTSIRRQHVIDIMKMCNKVTFSTQFLKDFYTQNFGITHSYVVPNYLPKFLWQPSFNDKRPRKNKPVVCIGGSSSHIGKNGDWEFLVPMVSATLDEIEWVFIGVVPPALEGKVIHKPWVNVWEYPAMMQQIQADVALAPIADSVFNLAKSDLKYIEYSAMNIPAVCTSIGNGKGPYDLVKCPNLVPASDADAIYQKIKELYKDESLRENTLKIQQQHVNGRWLENEEAINLYKNVYLT